MSLTTIIHGLGVIAYDRYAVTLPTPQPQKSLQAQIMIVTGANSGLGFEASKHLSGAGLGKLILAVRNTISGEKAKKDILAATDREESSIEVWTLDMNSYVSVKAFAARVATLSRVDAVAANAGIMTSDFALSEGYESVLNVNVISTFLLYTLLLPIMRRSAQATGNPCRFTVPNSGLHFIASTKELDKQQPDLMRRLSDPKSALMSNRYPLSKLLVTYVVRQLANKENSAHVIINTPNPSFCRSNLASDRQKMLAFRLFTAALARTSEEGSRTIVHGMLAGTETHGKFLRNCRTADPAKIVTSNKGLDLERYIFEELLKTLDAIEPGVSTNLQ